MSDFNAYFVSATLLLACAACVPDQTYNGTQIGFEDGLGCEISSTEVLTDLEAVPAGFAASPQDILDIYAGEFQGTEMDTATLEDIPLENATADATLFVALAGTTVTLEHYEPVEDPYENDPIKCPSQYAFDLGMTLTAGDLPAFAATLRTTSSEGSDHLWAESTDLAAFDGDLPEPTTFDPVDFERVESHVHFRGHNNGWWVDVSWEASNPSEAAPDGDLTILNETLVVASLEPN